MESAPARPRSRSHRPGRGPYAAGVRRERELLDVVLRIIAREGVTAVSHRAVAREAGASLGSTTYYFASKAEMIRRAFRLLAERQLAAIEAATRALPGGVAGVEQAAALAVDVLFAELRTARAGDPPAVVAEFELILEIAREPDFAPEYREFQRRLDALLQAAARRVGVRSPARTARIVHAFMRGFQLEQLSRPDRPRTRRQVRADLVFLLRALRALETNG
jgi:DNA-binding transcriptional regulator YbjK